MYLKQYKPKAGCKRHSYKALRSFLLRLGFALTSAGGKGYIFSAWMPSLYIRFLFPDATYNLCNTILKCGLSQIQILSVNRGSGRDTNPP